MFAARWSFESARATPANVEATMKRCPKCRHVETDDTLTFCRADGTPLVRESVSEAAGTLKLGSPPTTDETETQKVATRESSVGSTANTTVLDPQRPAGSTQELSKPKSRRGIVIGAAAVITVVLAVATYLYLPLGNKSAEKNSIAVLPFQNASDDPDVEYLSDGISESIINSLSELPNVRVLARSTMFSFKGKEANPQEVGRQLGVETVLTGRVIQRGNSLTVQTDLVNVADGSQLWGERYNRTLTDVLAVQEEIVRDVSQKLQARLMGAGGPKAYTANHEAYQLYLKGRFFWSKRTAKDLERAIEHFQQAINIDPTYALAYTGLADTYALTPFYGSAQPRDAMPKAREAARKALALDEGLAEAHAALGLVLDDYDYDFAGAEREYRRALELNPNYVTARQWYGELLMHLGRHDQAVAEMRRALELDPLSLIGNKLYGDSLYFARRYEEAVVQLNKTLELDSSFAVPHRVLGYIHEMRGDYKAAVEEFAKFQELNGNTDMAAAIRRSFAEGGWQGYLRIMIGKHRPANLPSYMAARFHASLGETAKAFSELNKAYENREFFLVLLKVDPVLDPLRADPRFTELVRKVGFPE